MQYADNYCTYREEFEPDHVYVYTGPVMFEEGRTHTVRVPASGLYAYRRGAKIQEAFPNMTPDDREFLISGIGPEKWDKLFKED